MFKVLWAIQPAKFFLILSVSALISFSSCNKASVVGLDVQPENDLIDAYYQDTLTLITQTIKEDSLRTDGNLVYTGIGLIGKYHDPVFGLASSSIYSQLLMYSNAPSFGTKPVVDSVRLTLTYSAMYGKKAKPRQSQMINVYQLAEDLDINSPYYSNKLKSYGLELTTTNGYVFKPRPTDSIVIFGKPPLEPRLAPALRVPIQNSFGQMILDTQNRANLATNASFIKFIKGLYITTENTTGIASPEGNIINFNMFASKLNIYYHNSTDDSLQYDLSLAGARYMYFNHTYVPYAEPDLQKQLTGQQQQNDIVFVQSMAGLKTKVLIPNLVTWGKKEFIAINRAELVIKSISLPKDTFAVIPALNLLAISDDKKTPYILPDALEGTSYFGGIYDTRDSSYHFTITRQVQQLISGTKANNGFYIVSANGSSQANRVVLGGGSPVLNGGSTPNNYKMKLKITYTKLK